MYNHYIPGSAGVYERRTVEEPKKDLPCPPFPKPEPEPEPPCEQPECVRREQPAQTGGPFSIDLGDLLLLCIVLLILLDCDGEDHTSLLITAAAFLLL